MYSLIIITIFVALFANTKTKTDAFVMTTDGEYIRTSSLIKNVKENQDSSKNKSGDKTTLDGEKKINTPDMFSAPIDTTLPFNKLTFRTLRTYIPGKDIPQEIKDLNGKNVEINGFMTPLTALQDMDEFLLCSAPPLSCYCAPPIFINEIIYVKLKNNLKTDYKTGVINIKGRLNINFDIKDEYSDVIYTIDATGIK